jgi:AcrR family transcriptional regulator
VTADPAGNGPILDAALPQFAERGYENTTLDAIGVAAGIDRPGIELLFATKARLFATLLDRELDRVRLQISAAVPTDAGEDSLGRAVGRALDRLLARVRDSPSSWRLVVLADFGSYGERHARDEVRDVLRTRLRWLVASAAPLEPHDRRIVSETLAVMVAALFEVSLGPLLAGEPVTPPNEVEHALDLLFGPRAAR